MNEEKAVEILKDIKEVLDDLKVDFWLESGALLGAIRDGGFIKWDIDIDIGTSDKYIPMMKIISVALKKKKFEVYFSTYNNCMGFWRDGISVDFPFWRIDGENATAPLRYVENFCGKVLYYLDWILLYSHVGILSKEKNNIKYRILRYTLVKLTDLLTPEYKIRLAVLLRKIAIKSKNRRGLVIIPSKFYLDFKTIEFYGMKLKAPNKVEEYLSYYFGDDWDTPKQKWNYVESKDSTLSKTENIGLSWDYRKVQTI